MEIYEKNLLKIDKVLIYLIHFSPLKFNKFIKFLSQKSQQ